MGVLLLALALILTGCDPLPKQGGIRKAGGSVHSDGLDAVLDVQLGELAPLVTAAERAACMEILETLWPIRTQRLEQGEYDKSDYEWRLLRRLNKLYETYTVQYLNPEAEDFGYQYPPEEELAVYKIQPDASLVRDRSSRGDIAPPWTEDMFLDLWDSMLLLLPEGAFQNFTRLTIFTDGAQETMAYVFALDAKGTRWEIALDIADSGDGEIFTETVLHEYCHYLTLNAEQAAYTERQTTDTYNEPGMVTRAGSYLDDFYQRYWTGYLDDCLASGDDTYNFFLRHYDDFIDSYASTDPSEDICESFTFFVLRPRDPDADEEVWSQKLDFFYGYPELVEFRKTVRDNLGLAEDEHYETYYGEEDAA